MRDGGTLRIVLREPDRSQDPGVVVSVRDTGTGIQPENLPRLFEPFFTTKPAAGTGLGLWVVRQFVESWGGTVDVQSSIDPQKHGTAFTLFFPLISVTDGKQKTNAAFPPLM
jgi:signal transduction histidine kinase